MARTEGEKIRVGLLLEESTPEWTARLIELLAESADAEIRLVVRWAVEAEGAGPAPGQGREAGGRSADWRHRLCRLYLKWEKRLVRPEPDAFAPRDVARLLAGVPTLTVRRAAGADGGLTEEDTERIARAGLDVLLLPGGGELKGGILKAARYGVWALRHGAEGTGEGMPAGFREVFEGRPVTGAALERRGETPAETLTLMRTWTATAPLSVTRNRHNSIWKALRLAPRALRELRRLGGERFMEEARKKSAETHHDHLGHALPGAPDSAGHFKILGPLARHLGRYVTARLDEALRFDQWFLLIGMGDGEGAGAGEKDGAAALDPALKRRLMPPEGCFWADPFVVRREGRYSIFFEEYPVRTDKGIISVITVDDAGNWSGPVAALERPYHLSYPFVFEWQGADWMMPETMANGTVELYRCTRWPDRWAFEKNLMENIRAVDATLHYHGGKWWMFANVRESEEISENDELFLYYADSPLSGHWTPHPQNPIVSDVRGARPAGRLFERGGAIYRPSQVCAPDYGRAIRINRVVRWDEEAYEETVAETIEPGWARDVLGVHTINFTEGMTVMDARRKRRKR